MTQPLRQVRRQRRWSSVTDLSYAGRDRRRGWVVVGAGQSEKPERTPQVQTVRPTYRVFRLIIIVLILLVAVSIGFHFRSRANPGEEPSSFSGQPPQYINVYVSNPDIRIKVAVALGQGFYNVDYDRYGPVDLHAQGFTDFLENVSFTATYTGAGGPGAIIITSSIRPLAGGIDSISDPGSPAAVVRLADTAGTLAQVNRFAAFFPLSTDQKNNWYGTVSFGSVPIIFQDNGSVFGHLPSVAAYSYLYPPSAVLEGEFDAGTSQLEGVTLAGPSPARERAEDFYAPNSQASYTEVVQHIVPALDNTQTAYMNPPADSTSDADYMWQSNGIDGLEPVFKMIDLNAADSQNQAAFYSGIAFGLAGSTVIALVQEIPSEGRKRKSSTSGTREPKTDPPSLDPSHP
jgi:hypothetical protein